MAKFWLVIVLLMTGCVLGDAATPDVGGLALPLGAPGRSGERYRLLAELQVRDASRALVQTLRAERSSDATELRAELDVGDYTITLLPGFQLLRVGADHDEAVEAVLLNAQQSFAIRPDETALVTFRFVVGGEEVVTQTGDLGVRFDIDDQPDAAVNGPLGGVDAGTSSSASWSARGELGAGRIPALRDGAGATIIQLSKSGGSAYKLSQASALRGTASLRVANNASSMRRLRCALTLVSTDGSFSFDADTRDFDVPPKDTTTFELLAQGDVTRVDTYDALVRCSSSASSLTVIGATLSLDATRL